MGPAYILEDPTDNSELNVHIEVIVDSYQKNPRLGHINQRGGYGGAFTTRPDERRE